MMDFVVANRVFVKAEYSEEFESRFRNRAGQINQQPGFVVLDNVRYSANPC